MADPAPIRLLTDPPAPGAWNMAIDEALMASARQGRITLRFYRWEPGCLSLGRNQTARGWVDADELAARGVDIVRRPTGGRAVYHHRELTYCVTLPDRAWGGPRRTYARVNRALAHGLERLGVAVDDTEEARPRGPTVRPGACFEEPAAGEVVAGGRKLVGSAQWRHRGTLLQHGSILIRNEQELAGAAPAAVGLAELLPEIPPIERLVGALSDGMAEEFGAGVEPARLGAREEAAARRLEGRYLGPEWTWRR